MSNNNITDISTIGKRIQRLREGKGLSQSELAKEINVKQQTVNQWEKGERDLKTGAIISLASFFDVSTDYILCVSDYKTPDNADIGEKIGLFDDNIIALKNITRKVAEKNEEEKLFILNDFLYEFLTSPCCNGTSNIDTIYETIKNLYFLIYNILIVTEEQKQEFEKFKKQELKNFKNADSEIVKFYCLLNFYREYYNSSDDRFLWEIGYDEFIDVYAMQKVLNNYFDLLQNNYCEHLKTFICYNDLQDFDMLSTNIETFMNFRITKDFRKDREKHIEYLVDKKLREKRGKTNGND